MISIPRQHGFSAISVGTRSTTFARALLFTCMLGTVAFAARLSAGEVMGRYVRVENPAGQQMTFSALEIFSEGKDVALHRADLFSGTGKDPEPPDRINRSEGRSITSGEHPPTSKYGQEFRGRPDPISQTLKLNPWFELDFGKLIPIEKVVLAAANFPNQEWGDQHHRVISILDADRKVIWAAQWDGIDAHAYPDGIFTFMPTQGADNPLIGRKLPVGVTNWVPMGWLLGAKDVPPLPDADRRMKHFAMRDDATEVAKLARGLFAQLDRSRSDLAGAFKSYAAGDFQEALDAWKRAWFVKMAKVNLHVAIHRGFLSYPTQGDDMADGVEVTVGDRATVGAKYIPGQMHWIDLPERNDPNFYTAMGICELKGMVGRVSRPLLESYGRNPDPKYIKRWAEIMDDWALNYFVDAQKTPYEAENIFVMNQSAPWGTMMEDLSDLAKSSPAMIDLIPATTLARVQLICLEKYGSAWIYQDRYTTFIHLTSGIKHWDMIDLYLDDLLSGQRVDVETRQATERWIEMCTERDGSTVDIGDEGHFEYSPQVGFSMSRLNLMKTKPAWYTDGWRNRFNEYYDNIFKYFLRHPAPGGYDHRDNVAYRSWRWAGTAKYYHDWTTLPVINHDATIHAIPEVRRILDALGHITTPLPTTTDPNVSRILEQKKAAHDEIQAALGADRPGAPHINSDWMPYSGLAYFRSDWGDNGAFIAMLANGSKGGSSHPFPYDMMYHYDYNTPLSAAQPFRVDGKPPQQLFGRWSSFQPGTKIDILTYAQEKPLPARWHSDGRFDFGEAIFHGAYQDTIDFSGEVDRKMGPEKPAVTGMTATRQMIQLRSSRLFIMTDAIRSGDQKPHDYSMEYRIALSSKKEGASRPYSPDQLSIDPKALVLRSNNPDGASVAYYQFSDQPMEYRKGNEEQLDYNAFSPRLGNNVGIARQRVYGEFKARPAVSLVTLISSSETAGQERVASTEAMNAAGAIGFHAVLKDGGEIWYQTTTSAEAAKLSCGAASATAQALLVQKDHDGVSGMAFGASAMSLDGKPVENILTDFEFVSHSGQIATTGIYSPIDPVTFAPNRNAFVDTQLVTLLCTTPNCEIRYTTDGTPPTSTSTVYSAPLTISASTEFAARAFRLGRDGKQLPADEFEINGTKFTVPSYGWFYKKDAKPALEIAEKGLLPGLNYEYLQAPWWRLFVTGHWLADAGGGVADRELDLSKVTSSDAYGMRYKGYLKIPEDGLYTFKAPAEFISMEHVAGYDLRVWVDGEEWYLTQWWHGQGTWSVPLKQGFHSFQVDYADQRTTPYRKSGCWNYYPRESVLYQGAPSPILISGPGIDHARIPKEWLYRVPQLRTFEDERTLVDPANDLNCAFDGVVDVSLMGLDQVCFKCTGAPKRAFAKLRITFADGRTQTFAQLAASGKQIPAGLLVDLHTSATRLSGSVDVEPKRHAEIVYRTPGTEAPH